VKVFTAEEKEAARDSGRKSMVLEIRSTGIVPRPGMAKSCPEHGTDVTTFRAGQEFIRAIYECADETLKTGLPLDTAGLDALTVAKIRGAMRDLTIARKK
jgi:hypothetical protein